MKKHKIFLYLNRMLVCLLILIQITFFVYLIVSTSRLSVWIQIFFTIISFLVVLRVISKREKSGFKIIWVFLILAFPIFGGLTYLFFHIQNSSRKFRKSLTQYEFKNRSLFFLSKDSYEDSIVELSDYKTNITYLQKYVGFPIFKSGVTEYLSPGEVFFERLLEELNKAEKYIFLEFFIIDDGEMWLKILEVLEKKVLQGVDVRVMYDDVGSFLLLPTDFPQQLAKKGIKCSVFNQFKPAILVSLNNRDHRKIVIIDGKIAFTGGINLADEYINRRIKYGHWKDSSIMISGYSAWTLTVVFLELWTFSRKQAENFEEYYPWKKEQPLLINDGYIQPYADSPTDLENVGEHVYLHIITEAKNYLYIQTPYFILDDSVVSALCLASKSGVDVKIILPGIWDKYLIHMTTRSFYKELISSNVQVYEYTPGFIHSKVFVSDDIVATVGSTNLDYRSLYHHFECGVCLYKSSQINSIKEDFIQTLKSCKEISQEDVKANIFTNLGREVLRIFAPLM